MSGRWKITVRDDNGRAIISMLDGNKVVGVANIAVHEYDKLCRTVMSAFTSSTNAVLLGLVQNELWQRAQRGAEEDAEVAKRRLLELGWNNETIKQFVVEMTMTLAGEMLSRLPEHVK